MKIIGKTSEGFIATITNNEVKSILALNDSRKNDLSKIDIGDELTFTVALSNLNLLRDIQLSGQYKALHDLKNAQERLGEIISIIEKTEAKLADVQKQIYSAQS